MRPFVQLSIFVCYLFPGQSNLLAANAVVERVRQLSLPGSFVGMPIPIWQNGFFLRFDFHPASAPAIFVHDNQGVPVFETNLHIDGSVNTKIYAMASTAGGTVAVSGSAIDQSGGGGTFIAWLDSKGTIQKLTRLNSYVASKLCFDANGNLWTVGRASPPQRTEPDHDIVRVYGPNGLLNYSLVPRSSIHTPENEHPARKVAIASNGKEILVFSISGSRLLRFSSSGQILGEAPISLPDPLPTIVTGFSFTANGEIFLSGQAQRKLKGNDTEVQDQVIFKYGPGSSKWIELYSSLQATETPKFRGMFGYDNGLMLVGTGYSNYEWVSLK